MIMIDFNRYESAVKKYLQNKRAYSGYGYEDEPGDICLVYYNGEGELGIERIWVGTVTEVDRKENKARVRMVGSNIVMTFPTSDIANAYEVLNHNYENDF